MSEAPESPAASRRTVLCGAAAVLAAGGTVALSGCASGGSATTAKASAPATPKEPVVVGPAADVPVGGGKVYREKKIVVTQPSAGQYEAFSAVCTHAGCVVDKVEDQLIKCPCHGSSFNMSTGARVEGPAIKPLPEYQVAVDGGNLKVTPV
ncbi:Rieske (2Fe-2S) protein [Kitasatospora sp. A2-31]|uniref:Rieske (2Fe-2S) protein n=1 Tax=Kitasatospora sp. A2-31 TaxID=2916414 RepID=UPI001EEBA1E8|nr:Rieske (2Fe-2S) protein [Kitasatospora sp. A2-31]MCG6496653.1 Rieske (2Fe-2S) protein [Kitasatospora sp. A2-31]